MATLISVRDTLNMKRQVFFVGVDAFDTQDDQTHRQIDALAEVSQALKACYDASVELGVASGVTACTAPDFRRTASTNGSSQSPGANTPAPPQIPSDCANKSATKSP